MGDLHRGRAKWRAPLGVFMFGLALVLLVPGGPVRAAGDLPSILSETDAALYDRIFILQDAGQWADADQLMTGIDDPILMGHLLDQRLMHPTAYRSKFSELAGYLEHYADHPEAGRVYRLARKRQPEGAASPPKPVTYRFDNGDETSAVNGNGTANGGISIPIKPLDADDKTRRRSLEREITSRVRRGWPTGATDILTTTEFQSLVSDAQYDRLQAKIAWSYFAYDKDELGYRMAAASAGRSGALMPHAYWTAGLAAWRLGDMNAAQRHFEALARAELADGALKAAGAYWAARANLIERRPERISAYLAIAATHPETFYGLIARRALGRETKFQWQPPPLDPSKLQALLHVPGARRAIALVEAGQPLRAERELRRLTADAPVVVLHGLLVIAATLDIPSVQMTIAGRLMEVAGERHLGFHYPIPGWAPAEGYTVDPALIYAVIRQESKFITRAKSKRGARGVMQLMPKTAASMARMVGLGTIDRNELFEPELNITLGQAYIRYLLEQDLVSNNLFFLTAAYNSGPVKLGKWQRENRYFDDPLLFMESISSPETRHFIETVVTNFWMYQLRLGEPTPTLDAVAAGGWPLYIPNQIASETLHAGH